jgi:flagellar biosynthesis/type III secretory pathway chaperone
MGGTKLNIMTLKNGGSSFNFEIPFMLNFNEVYLENAENNITDENHKDYHKSKIHKQIAKSIKIHNKMNLKNGFLITVTNSTLRYIEPILSFHRMTTLYG